MRSTLNGLLAVLLVASVALLVAYSDWLGDQMREPTGPSWIDQAEDDLGWNAKLQGNGRGSVTMPR